MGGGGGGCWPWRRSRSWDPPSWTAGLAAAELRGSPSPGRIGRNEGWGFFLFLFFFFWVFGFREIGEENWKERKREEEEWVCSFLGSVNHRPLHYS